MEPYDPSLSSLLRRKLVRVFDTAWQLLPVWNPSSEPLDPDTVLDAKEIQIFHLYGLNRIPKEIAMRLFISVQSTETHLTIISRKLRIRRRDLQKVATNYALREGARENAG